MPRSAFSCGTCVLATLAPAVAFAQPAAPDATATLAPPRLVSDATVPYPEGGHGKATVLLTMTVNADGSVRSAVAADAKEPFSSTATRAAMAWRFEPATRSGKPVAARIRVVIVFQPPAPMPTVAPVPSGSTPPSPRVGAEEVLVRGAHEEPSRTASLTRAEVRQIPGVFGDPFRAIEVMPGVTPIFSGLPFFYIRGAPPGNVGYFLDGIRVPYLFHVGVGPSVVHPALIDRVDLYPGGYPARFGRFSGGVVSGETIEPGEHAHGEYNVRFYDAGAFAETPFDGGRGTVLLGGRYSFTALLLSLLSPDTVLSYWDYQGRATYDVTPRDRIGVFAFGANDFLGQKQSGTTQTLFGTQFHRGDVRYDHRLSENATMRTAATVGEDLTQVGSGQSVRDRLIGARTEASVRLSPNALLRAGMDSVADVYDVIFDPNAVSPSEAALASNFPTRTDLSAGVRVDIVLDVTNGLEVTPGARIDFFGSRGATAFAVDPRLSARARIVDRAHLLWALGIAHQAPAFAIPIPGFQPGGLKGGLQTAVQESMGVEWNLGAATTATATVFHNGFFNMSDALGVRQPQPSGCLPGSFPSDTLGGDAVNDGQAFVAAFDRTHVVNAAAAYDLGRNWRAGARVTFYTGLPKAPEPSGALCDQTCLDGIALRSLRDVIKVVYNAKLQSNPVGPQDQTTKCLPSGTVHVYGMATSNADQGTTNVDLTYVLTQCKFSETDSDPTHTFSMTLTGTLTESGTIAVQPSSTTALQIKGSITFSGTVYRPEIMYSEPTCTVLVGQNGNNLSGTMCGRPTGVAL